MEIDDNISHEKLKYNIDLKADNKKYQFYHQVQLINMNILQLKKHYYLI